MPDHQNLKMAEREGYDPTLMMDYEAWLLARFDSRDGVPHVTPSDFGRSA